MTTNIINWIFTMAKAVHFVRTGEISKASNVDQGDGAAYRLFLLHELSLLAAIGGEVSFRHQMTGTKVQIQALAIFEENIIYSTL